MLPLLEGTEPPRDVSWGERTIDEMGIGGSEATTCAAQRQQAKAANGTINRELAVLTKMLRLAFENGKLLRLPVLRKLRESAPREGFFEREQFQEVRRRLPEDLQVAVSLAYALGWRMQSEVLSLQRRQVDLEAGTLRLEPGTTENDEGRVVFDRYHIVSPSDLQDVARRLSGTIAPAAAATSLTAAP